MIVSVTNYHCEKGLIITAVLILHISDVRSLYQSKAKLGHFELSSRP